MTDQLEHRVTRLEAAVNGLAPELNKLNINVATMAVSINNIAEDMETVKALAQQAASSQIAFSKCSATQEERWKAHDKAWNELTTVVKTNSEKIGSNTVSLARVLAFGGGGGILGGGLLTLIIEFVRVFKP